MKNLRWIAVALVAVALLLGLNELFSVEGSEVHDPAQTGRVASIANDTTAGDSMDSLPQVSSAQVPTVEASSTRTTVDEIGSPEPTSESPRGRLRFAVVDPLEPAVDHTFTVRFLSANSIAEVTRTRVCDDTISTNRYDALVRVPGYEPIEIPGIEITENSTTDLGTLNLARGSGNIRGNVQLYSLTSDVPSKDRVFVELRGASRRPCANCSNDPANGNADSVILSDSTPSEHRAIHCPTCGYSKDISLFQIVPGEDFRFPNLASGHYRLRAWQPERDTIGVSTEVQLAAGETRFVSLRLLGTADLCLQFQYEESGAPFSGIELVDDVVRIHSFQIHLSKIGFRPIELTYSPPIDAQRFQFSGRDPQVLLETLVQRLRESRSSSFVRIQFARSDLFEVRPTRSPPPSIGVRPRAPDDRLDAPILAPETAPGPIGVEPGAQPNECLIRNLATGHYSLRVVAGNRTSGDLEVDIPSSGQATLIVPLRIDPDLSANSLEAPVIEIEGKKFSTPPNTHSVEFEIVDSSGG